MHKLDQALFLLKTGLWPSYCQIATDLGKILHTPTAVRNTLVGRLRPRSARGRLQAKPERLFFVILVTHRKSYRDDGSPRFRRQTVRVGGGLVLSWKISEFCGVGGARSKNSIFRVLGVPFDYPAHSLQETVLPQINDTDGKPRLWRCAFC